MITQCSNSSTRVFRSRFVVVCVCVCVCVCVIEHLYVCPVTHLHLHPEQGTYPLLFYISPWRRILEKLIVPQLVKFATFYGTSSVITMFTGARHLPLSWARLIQSIHFQSISCKAHFNIFLPSTPGFSKWFLFFSFPYQNCVHLCSPPYILYDALISSSTNWPQ